MAKRAFIIIGPESSGTRLLAKLFINAGCAGDDGHRQRFDEQKPEEEFVVIRRSYPYRKKWPNLGKLARRLGLAGYMVSVVVVVRNLQYTALSSQRQKHTKSAEKAQRRSTEAFKRIGASLLETELPFVWVTYEALAQRPQETLVWLFDWAGLPVPSGDGVYDGNAKYGGGE